MHMLQGLQRLPQQHINLHRSRQGLPQQLIKLFDAAGVQAGRCADVALHVCWGWLE